MIGIFIAGNRLKAFVEELDAALKAHSPSARGLSALQRHWLSFCLMAIMVTNSLCWSRFERAGLGRYSQAALSWMFRHAKLPWEVLLQRNVELILRRHGIHSGSLLLDDTDKRRSKVTRRIAKVHKLKDKTSGGFLMGQNLVFLLLVSDRITVPVGVAFYEPDAVRRAWVKQDKKLKQQGLAKGQRPPEPPRNPAYPTKAQYFTRYPGVVQTYRRRGGQSIRVWVSSARLYVEAHGKKRFVIALKYEGESEYRYLVVCALPINLLDRADFLL